MTTSAQPYRVPNKIHAAILQSDAIPQFGHVPAFPWQQLASVVSKHLELEGLKLNCSDGRWIESTHAAADLGSPLTTFSFRLNGIDGGIYFLIPDEFLNQFIGWILTKTTDRLGVTDHDIIMGLRKFVAIEMCHCFEQTKYMTGLVPMVAAETQLPDSGVVHCYDLSVEYKEQTVIGRLAFSSAFMESWRGKTGQQKTTTVPNELAKSIEVEAHLASGTITLSPEQWANLKPGDFLIPDSCFLELDAKSGKAQGHAWMTVNGVTVAHANVRRNGQVEIIQTAQG